MDLKEALQLLDVSDDSHWTADGLPVVAVVSNIVGQPVTRKEITDASPQLTRESLRTVEPTEAPPEVEGLIPEVQRLAEVNAEMVIVQKEFDGIQLRLNTLNIERRALREIVRQEYDHKTDQDRRMEVIRLNHERKVVAYKQREIALRGIDPRALMSGKSPLDVALGSQKKTPSLPPRLREQTS